MILPLNRSFVFELHVSEMIQIAFFDFICSTLFLRFPCIDISSCLSFTIVQTKANGQIEPPPGCWNSLQWRREQSNLCRSPPWGPFGPGQCTQAEGFPLLGGGAFKLHGQEAQRFLCHQGRVPAVICQLRVCVWGVVPALPQQHHGSRVPVVLWQPLMWPGNSRTHCIILMLGEVPAPPLAE